MVDESSSGNCPVCVDPFQIGDQVPLSLFKAFKKLFFAAAAPWVRRVQPACLPPRLPPGLACKVENLILSFTPHPPLLRHSTCPVCRQTLGGEEEEGYDGGDENEED